MDRTTLVEEPHGSSNRAVWIILIIVLLALIIGGLSYWLWRRAHPTPSPDTPPDSPPDTPTPSPPDTPPSPSTANFPCPTGWTFDGVSKCTNGTLTYDLANKTLPMIRNWAKANNVSSWPGILCPPGWGGIGTSDNYCGNVNSHCSPANFDTVQFQDPKMLAEWAKNCGITSWPGVLCPVNWTGLGTAASPCTSTAQSLGSNCASAIFDGGSYTTYDAIGQWAIQCNLKDSYYSAGHIPNSSAQPSVSPAIPSVQPSVHSPPAIPSVQATLHSPAGVPSSSLYNY